LSLAVIFLYPSTSINTFTEEPFLADTTLDGVYLGVATGGNQSPGCTRLLYVLIPYNVVKS